MARARATTQATPSPAPSGFVYVLTNPAMPGLVKIGYTAQGVDVSQRIAQLYSTEVPFPFELKFACKTDKYKEVEDALHTAFQDRRPNPRREFFTIEPVQAIAILKLFHVKEATQEVAAEIAVESQKSAEILEAEESSEAFKKERSERRPNLEFEDLGIPLGATLTFIGEPAATAIVAEPRKVKLADGTTLSLSAATRMLNGGTYGGKPSAYWLFGDKKLSDIWEDKYGIV